MIDKIKGIIGVGGTIVMVFLIPAIIGGVIILLFV